MTVNLGSLEVETVGDLLPPIGHNNPPEPTPYEKIKQEIDDLYAEAKNWFDGEPITTEGQAAEVAKLREKLRGAAKRAEEQRKLEAKPFDDGKAEVQERYNPLIQKDRGRTDLAIKSCNSALKPYLDEIDRKQREAALEAQRAAQQAAHEAQKAAHAAAETNDLGKRETAEQMIANAKSLVADAARAEKAKPQVKAEGAARAVGMKSVFNAVMLDPAAAIQHYRETQPAALKAWMQEQADKDVRAGARVIPGFRVDEERVPV